MTRSSPSRAAHTPAHSPLSSPTRLLLAAGSLALVLASPALAQQDQRRQERAIRQAEQADEYRLRVDTNLTLAERTQFDAGGSYTISGLWLTDSSGNSRRLIQNEFDVYARGSIDGVHNAFVRLKFPHRDFSEGDSFDGRGDRWPGPFLDRYIYEFDYAKAVAAYEGLPTENNFNLKIGRQFVDWGQSIVLSETLLSVRPTITIENSFTIEGLAGLTPDTTIDFDSSRDAFDRRTRRAFFGGKLAYSTPEGQEFYAYALKMVDYNTNPNPRARLPGITRVNFNYESTYLAAGTTGPFGQDLFYQAEFVWQQGHSQSDPVAAAQTREIVQAIAGRFVLTYLLRDEWDSRLQFEQLFASGDSDRGVSTDTVNGNRSGTKDHAYNSLGFANTGLAFAPNFSNLIVSRLGTSTFPFRSNPDFRDVQIGLDGLLFAKYRPSGGFDEPTNGRSFLGGEFDLFINYRVTSDFAVGLRYGLFLPGEAITNTHHARNFFLLSATLSF